MRFNSPWHFGTARPSSCNHATLPPLNGVLDLLVPLVDHREWSPHAGIELSAGLTSLIDLPLALAGGLDVPLRTAADAGTWRWFLSANLPLRLYTLLLAD